MRRYATKFAEVTFPMIRSVFWILFVVCYSSLTMAEPTVINVWPDKAPGEKTDLPPEANQTKPSDPLIAGKSIIKLGNVSTPQLAIYRPDPDKSNGTSVIVCPGGGHNILAYDLEGTEVASWLNSLGITGIVLKYRVPARDPVKRWIAAVQDAQRSVSLIRSRAGEWKLDPDRIGICGFSAGGETAALTSVFSTHQYQTLDYIESVSSRPNFAMLIYPGGFIKKEGERLPGFIQVDSETPPMFIVHAFDDPVPVGNSLHFAELLAKAKISTELHVFATGGHGYGIRQTKEAVTNWPSLAKTWMRERGLLEKSLNINKIVPAPESPQQPVVQQDPVEALRDALVAQDIQAIRRAVAFGRAELGEKAGQPEVDDEHALVSYRTQALTRVEAKLGFSPHLDRLKKLVWWRIGLDPTKLAAPLRVPASIVSGCTAVAKAKLRGADECLAHGIQAAEFMIWAQEQAGAGCFPFPAARLTSADQSMKSATRFLESAEKAGVLTQVVKNGWVFDDLQDGGLQFDNGECGVAMFELYELTKDHRYLDSAKKAATWAVSRPLVTNWNYNSFSVHLLAKAYSVTLDPRYLDAAIKKAVLGVVPGQLEDGPHAGRWMDPHNARPAYHYIMLSSLAQLVAVMPKSHPEYERLLASLQLGLKARNSEIIERGVMSKDKVAEALLLVEFHFGDDHDFMTNTFSDQALDVLARYCSEETRVGKLPLSPHGWGKLLVYLSEKGE
jgi:acetyl esterase/lipase